MKQEFLYEIISTALFWLTIGFFAGHENYSVSLTMFSIWLAYWFWKNPIDTAIKDKHVFLDKNGDVKYVAGTNHKGWIVQRINLMENRSLGQKIKSSATIKNNPGIKSIHQAFEELEKLNYE